VSHWIRGLDLRKINGAQPLAFFDDFAGIQTFRVDHGETGSYLFANLNFRIGDYTSTVMELDAFVPNKIRVVLFDVGGVLVEPSGVATMLAWMRNSVSAEQLWRMWLTSFSVRAFETGRLSPEAFAETSLVSRRFSWIKDQRAF
jgi:hypothetical protein